MFEPKHAVELRPGERIDDLERNGYGIIQNSGAFCFGMDAVLLSGFARVRSGETIVDLGTGTGILPILLEAKSRGARFYGIEIQAAMAEMARRSVRMNGQEAQITILDGDIREIARGTAGSRCTDEPQGMCKEKLRETRSETSGSETDAPVVPGQIVSGRPEDGVSGNAAGLLNPLYGRADAVTSNPPYMKNSHGLTNPDDSKAVARHEICCTLPEVCQAAARLLRGGGRFYLVHRPLRLPEILTALREVRLEPKRIRPVYPFADREANLVLIEAVKHAAPECRFERPLIVYREPGVYTDEILEIYGKK